MWAELRQALSGRALFQASGGLLVFNLDDPTAPYAQTYVPVIGWPGRILVDRRQILIAAGPYGIYDFGLDDFNLLPPPG